ncbi:MAG: hypothetical protein CM15mP74_08280 [Halieaceae bacterium]|nr:MAG: hypothetical protein CM15mP74_08280 [Halieaceae bacterium]
MDIQMPGLTGLEVVERTQADRLPAVIFATAFDEFACQAFDLHAVDYVVKPFDPSGCVWRFSVPPSGGVADWVSGKAAPLGAIADMREATEPNTVTPTSAITGDCRLKMAGTPICYLTRRLNGSTQQGTTCACMPRAMCTSSDPP